MQSKETSTAPWSAAWPCGWWRQKRGDAQPRSKRQAASHGLAWTIHQKNSDCKQTRVQESANFQVGGPEKLTGADDPQHALQKNGGLAELRYMDDGNIMCHPILVPSFLQEFDVSNAKVGAEREP